MTRIPLTGQWTLKLDPEKVGLAQGWQDGPLGSGLTVSVPGCIQQLAELADAYPSVNEMKNAYLGTSFLERTFDLPARQPGQRCVLVFGGIAPSAHIFLNGTYVGRHAEPLCEARFPVTDLAVWGSENRVTVVIEEEETGLLGGFRFGEMDWEGLYREAHVELPGALSFEDVYVENHDTARATVHFTLVNDDDAPASGKVALALADRQASAAFALASKGQETLCVPVDVKGLARWTFDAPTLHPLTLQIAQDGRLIAEDTRSVGLRRFHVEGTSILTDDRPLYLCGTGQEYFSPVISPLTDESIIRSRFAMLKAYGFTFFRYHTHVPTEEELRIADEMGLLLAVEVSLVSNFARTRPFEKGLPMLEQYVCQTRWHPCIMVYCLGNEGSQIMVNSQLDCNRALAGYEAIKRNTTEQLAMIAFGLQGELPELPNDIESPHLWSDTFLWAYDGLTDIPWEQLGLTANGKPCVVHEYGKFGVWPDPKEEALYPVNGRSPIFASHAVQALAELGLEGLTDRLVETSRRLSGICSRIIMEDARRQPYMSGAVLWTFFRRSVSNAGLADDMGVKADQPTAVFREGCNASTALLIDHGFQRRCLTAGVPERVEVTVSHFGAGPVENAMVQWRLEVPDGAALCEGTLGPITQAAGVTRAVGHVDLTVPLGTPMTKLSLVLTLTQQGQTLSRNAWDFWAFPMPASDGHQVLTSLAGQRDYAALKQTLPMAFPLSSVDSIITGCRVWRQERRTDTALRLMPSVVLSDQWDESTISCYEAGVPVLLIDTGHLPEGWITPELEPGQSAHDSSRFYSSFRAGWDRGNLATIIEPSPLLDGYTHDGFCDLDFYAMIQGSRSMQPSAVRQTIAGDAKCIVFSMCKTRVKAQKESIVQDPNAVKEQKPVLQRYFAARQQGYLMEVRDGDRKLVICTLNLTADIAGRTFLHTLVGNMTKG